MNSSKDYGLLKFIFFWSCFLVMGCAKSDKVSKMDLLTSGKWRITSHDVYLGLGIPTRDEYALYTDCRKDDYYAFYGNGTGEVNEGTTKCDPGNTQSKPFTWHFLNNEREINLFVSNWFININNTTLSISTVRTIGGDGEIISFTKY